MQPKVQIRMAEVDLEKFREEAWKDRKRLSAYLRDLIKLGWVLDQERKRARS